MTVHNFNTWLKIEQSESIFLNTSLQHLPNAQLNKNQLVKQKKTFGVDNVESTP